jgi:hypothetical protein
MCAALASVVHDRQGANRRDHKGREHNQKGAFHNDLAARPSPPLRVFVAQTEPAMNKACGCLPPEGTGPPCPTSRDARTVATGSRVLATSPSIFPVSLVSAPAPNHRGALGESWSASFGARGNQLPFWHLSKDMQGSGEMSPSERSTMYRLRATECVDLAETFSDIGARRVLLHMARVWLELAANGQTAIHRQPELSLDKN